MQLNEKYTELTFKNVTEETAALIIAALSEQADGFEEADGVLKAYFGAKKPSPEELKKMAATFQVVLEQQELESQNWNALWESNFEPVVVDDFVAVRASFHEPFTTVEHEILINPKMSFGTGHHATTWLMMQQMQKIDFKNKAVFDFGTGTGILAILAKILGASKVVATDLDEWSITNAQENFIVNNQSHIDLRLSDSAEQGALFDVILANINKNVLLATIPQLKAQLAQEGVLLLSGLLAADEQDIVDCALAAGLNLTSKFLRNNWLCIRLDV